MQTTEDSPIIRKTLELCELILKEPEFRELRGQIDAFEASEEAQTQLRAVMEKGEELTKKQNMGMPMSGEEVTEFESQRTQLLANPVAKGYLDAEETLHRVRVTVDQYIHKTFQLGRLPSGQDFEEGSCGPSCGCGH